MANTPNMDLIEPTPGVGGTPGPQWASEVNENFETIDEHDHTPGKGVPISPSAMSINADLPFNGFSATDLLSSQYQSQGAASALLASVQVVGGELTYVDSSGNIVAITAGGSVAGAVGSISGLSSPASAVYSAVTKSFTWSYDSAKTARMASADLIVYPYDGVTAFTNSITLKVPTTLAAAYSITFPGAVPTQDGLVAMSASGVLSSGVPTGTASAPGMAFAVQLNTGFYRSGANQLAASSNGAYVASFEPGQLKLVAGTVAAPAFTFNGDPDTGIYNSGSNVVAFAAGGVRTGFINTQGVNTILGTVALPSYTFDGDPNTGMYSPSADQLAFTTGGVQRLALTSAAATATVPFIAPNGTIALPGFRFTTESDTGFYRVGTDQIGFTCNGTAAAMISPAGMSVGGASTADCVKWKVFTGSVPASGSVTLTNPGTTLLGCFGVSSSFGSATVNNFMQARGTGATNAIDFNDIASPNMGLFNNYASAANTYRVVMFYR